MRYDSEHLTGLISTQPPAVPPSEVVHAAAVLLLKKGYFEVKSPTSGMKVGTYVNSFSEPATPFTPARIRAFVAALAGSAPGVGTVAEYRTKFFSLYLVEVVNGAFVCNCKGFWYSKVRYDPACSPAKVACLFPFNPKPKT